MGAVLHRIEGDGVRQVSREKGRKEIPLCSQQLNLVARHNTLQGCRWHATKLVTAVVSRVC